MDFALQYEGSWNKIVFTEEQKDYIVDKYLNEKDASTVTIGKEFRVSYPTIQRVLREREVSKKSLKSFRQKYNLNENFFETIDTEDKAYWLGFLYADGCMSESKKSIGLNLAAIDKSHLEKFKKSIESEHPIKESSKIMGEKNYSLNYINITCQKMYSDLVEKGCLPKKSLILVFPHWAIPDDLMHHFIRGYFDGDGCITYTTRKGQFSNRRNYKISILGTEDMLVNILSYLSRSHLSPKKERDNKHYTIYLGGNKQVKEIINYLYKDATIFLERKKQKCDECLKYIEDNPYVAWNKGMKKVQ